jgi:TolA-binding protein
MNAPSFRWRSLAGLRWAVAVAVLLTSGAVVGAVTAHRWWPPAGPTPASDETPNTVKRRPARHAHVAAAIREAPPEAAIAATTPDEMPGPSLAPTAETATPPPIAALLPPTKVAPARPHAASSGFVSGRRAMAMASAAPAPVEMALAPSATPPPQPVPSTLSGETQVLGQAVARLRQHHDATGALAALDLYRQRFPQGTLQREADVARVDALLTLGRDDGALDVLRTLNLQPRGHDQELQVIRGELASSSSCPRAVADFDAVLGQAAPRGLVERALYGRAACRVKQGDGDGATRDLRSYVNRFPSGRFAADARRALGEN